MSRHAGDDKHAGRRAISARWLRGGLAMAADTFAGTVDIVHGMHRAVGKTTAPINPFAEPGQFTRDFVYDRVRDIGALSFLGARQAAVLAETWLHSDPDDLPERVSLGLRGALNGAFGDYLERADNPLALSMCLADDNGRELPLSAAALAAALPAATGRVLLLIHGLGMHDQQWRKAGQPDFGDRLAAEHGYTVLRLRYNSGRHISDNGQALVGLLSELLDNYPVEIERLTIIGHSMGGLVARSACYYAARDNRAWLSRLADLVCLGTPHLGAPLERLGHWFNQGLTRVPHTQPLSAIGDIRSAGVQDLRHGHVLESDWRDIGTEADGTQPSPRAVPGPGHVGHLLVAATLGRNADDPRGRWFGDMLVPVDSATGQSPQPDRRFAARDQTGRVFYGMSHLALMHHEDVYDAIGQWLAPRLADSTLPTWG